VDWGYPVVHLGRDPGFETDLVVVDGKGAGRQAVQHLVALGHRRVAVLAGGDDNASFRERVEGYRAGLAQAGLAPRPEYEVRVPVTPGDGHAATLRLLALARPPTAIFAASNTLGIAAVGAIEAARLRCPRDVSVVSYDSYGWQEVFHPRLTTVRQPAYRLGARAAEALLARIEGRGGGVAERVVLDADLVIRESTAPPVAARR
jgi:LacI family transcriptional regulator